ncbi:uncharacterized protein [Aquarana catesbeiana]|uniref:uncharacterized protein n=1 Tax=Aquarana catesbeiana TaxID=8400 RepID=UPI003CCA59EC
MFVTIDVESLYSSIPHEKGVAAIKHVLRTTQDLDPTYSEFITSLLEHILSHNVFTFNGSHYLQVQGVAMGTCCAPSYANLYLGEWEAMFLGDEGLSMYTDHILCWYRYIDDLFIVWDGSIDLLRECLLRMNRNDFNLNFTMSFDKQCITFLDVEVCRGEEGSVISKLYRKSTASNAILHASSFHPKPLLNSIPYSQYLRAKRNCSDSDTFKLEANRLRDRLLLRGYSHASLKRSFKKALLQPREELLYSQKANKSDKNDIGTLRIITKFNNQHRQVRNIVTKYWHMLQCDPTLGPLVPQRPLFTFKRTTSLGDKITASEFKAENNKIHCKYKGTFMCGKCRYCKYMLTTRNPTLPNGQSFHPKHFANCRTFGVVYLLLCECTCFYVGKTKTEFWKRAYRHLVSMETGDPDLPLGRHTLTVHNGICPKIKFLILDRVHPESRGGDWNKTLLQLESRWIYNLRATEPPGLNETIWFKPFLEGFSSGGREQ